MRRNLFLVAFVFLLPLVVYGQATVHLGHEHFVLEQNIQQTRGGVLERFLPPSRGAHNVLLLGRL